MNNLLDAFEEDKKISIIFVEFPILSKSSFKASVASLAAHKQNKYREFHVNLMNYKGKIDNEIFYKIAKKLELNLIQFKNDLFNKDLITVIENNIKIAKLLKLRGTPAFIIGNTVYPGAMSKAEILEAIGLERRKLKNWHIFH